MSTENELRPIFDTLKAAAQKSCVVDYATRRGRLDRLKTLIAKHGEEIAEAINTDFGTRVHAETCMLELIPLQNSLRHTRARLRRWMRPKRRPISMLFQPSKGRLVAQPLGVVGIIAPWNYPVFLTLGPLIDVFAAGNRAMIKPSEHTPVFSDLLQKLLAQYFDDDEVQVVTGGVKLGKTFSTLPFDHLIFTGSTHIGREVAKAAAANLTPITLELGGKSPAVVTETANISKAAKSIAFGKFVNAGQTCVAPDYVLVPRAKMDDLAKALMKRITSGYRDMEDGYTSMINADHFQRQQDLLAEVEGKATILRHGADTQNMRKLAPAIVIDPPSESTMMREEVFGPILPLVPYDDLDAALDQINQGERPLALYTFSQNAAERAHIMQNTIAGGMTENGTLMHLAQDELPFGGVGASGTGVYHGYEGFKRFSHMKSVYQVRVANSFEMMGPPWGWMARLSYRMLGR